MTVTKIIETINNRSILTGPKRYLLLQVLKGVRGMYAHSAPGDGQYADASA